jgi:hypothetical protein
VSARCQPPASPAAAAAATHAVRLTRDVLVVVEDPAVAVVVVAKQNKQNQNHADAKPFQQHSQDPQQLSLNRRSASQASIEAKNV